MNKEHLTMEQLQAGLEEIRRSPKDEGVVSLIVRRPDTGEREVLESATLDLVEGLVGDNWRIRGSARTTNGLGHPEMQLNVMNARTIALVAQEMERWALAGDQFFLDMDLSVDNLPAGTQLAMGSAVIEITPMPHSGCKKFVERFGAEAVKFVNSPEGKTLRLRGLNAKVVQPGVVYVGDRVRKVVQDGLDQGTSQEMAALADPA
jgi:MOSC domain-containing protein YiiM